MNSINSFLDSNKERLIGELFDLLKIPSVSADSAYNNDVLEAAKFVASSLRTAGCDKVEICQTKGFPIIYGEKLTDPTLPTILVYGHYDVQPADPIELWSNPAFEPIIKKLQSIHKVQFLLEVLATIKDKCLCISKHWNI
jgi:acetylornithine deacetylase/succinyl-diaminopimelate desuccinylase-like protein